jgi:hypothetical protein
MRQSRRERITPTETARAVKLSKELAIQVDRAGNLALACPITN